MSRQVCVCVAGGGGGGEKRSTSNVKLCGSQAGSVGQKGMIMAIIKLCVPKGGTVQ